jgi:hypothetical protein
MEPVAEGICDVCPMSEKRTISQKYGSCQPLPTCLVWHDHSLIQCMPYSGARRSDAPFLRGESQSPDFVGLNQRPTLPSTLSQDTVSTSWDRSHRYDYADVILGFLSTVPRRLLSLAQPPPLYQVLPLRNFDQNGKNNQSRSDLWDSKTDNV